MNRNRYKLSSHLSAARMMRSDRVVPTNAPRCIDSSSDDGSNRTPPRTRPNTTSLSRNGSIHNLKHGTFVRVNSIRKSFLQVAEMELRMPQKTMECSIGVFRFLWVFILSIHVFLILISITAVYFFKLLLMDALWLQHLIERTGSRINHSVAYALAILSCLLIFRNFYGLLTALYWSNRTRTLVFERPHAYRQSREEGSLQHVRRFLAQMGVRGQYFNVYYVTKEIIEIIFQSVNAYQLSTLSSIKSMKRFAVAIVVLNCCSTPFCKYFFRRNLALERVICLILSTLINFCSNVIIPLTVIAPVYQLIDWEAKNWKQIDDFYIPGIQQTLHFQIYMAYPNTWWTFFSILVQSVGAIFVLDDVKTFLKPKYLLSQNEIDALNTKRVRAIKSVNTIRHLARQSSSANTHSSSHEKISSSACSPLKLLPGASVRLNKQLDKIPQKTIPIQEKEVVETFQKAVWNHGKIQFNQIIPVLQRDRGSGLIHNTSIASRFLQLLFLGYGMVIIGIHLNAEEVIQNNKKIPSPLGCHLTLQPWFLGDKSCNVLEINCFQRKIGGKATEIENAWQELSRYEDSLVQLIISHCPVLEIPSSIQRLRALEILEITNSTLISWNESAALTQSTHPRLSILLVVDLYGSMPVLPPGLLSQKFPHMLRDITLFNVGLKELPSNLDTLWHPDQLIFQLILENNQFKQFPAPLLKMNILSLGLSGNPKIIELPQQYIENRSIKYLGLNGCGVEILPANIGPGTKIEVLGIAGSHFSKLPIWFNEHFFQQTRVHLGDNPFFCGKNISTVLYSCQPYYRNMTLSLTYWAYKPVRMP